MNKFAEVLGREVVKIEQLDYEELKANIENPYKGSLQEVISLVQKEDLIPVYIKGELVGLNMITNKPYIEDQLLQQYFSQTYIYKPLLNWVRIAIALKEASITNVTVVDENILIAPEENTAFDLEGNVLANISDLDVLETTTKELVLTSLARHKKSEVKDPNVDIRSDEEELPSEVEIPLNTVDARLAEEHTKRYLKKKYKHCIARGTYPTLTRTEDSIKISNIQWGRKLTEDEYDKFFEKFYI